MSENAKNAYGKAIKVSADIAKVMFDLGRPVYIGATRDTVAVENLKQVTKLSQIKSYAYVDMPQETRGQAA